MCILDILNSYFILSIHFISCRLKLTGVNEWVICLSDKKNKRWEKCRDFLCHLTQCHSLTPGHPEDKFCQRRRGALPVHPTSSHHRALPGLPAALPVPPLQGPAAPGPGVQHRPLRAPAWGRGDRLPARLTLGWWAGLPLLSSAQGGSPPLWVFTTLLWGGHPECPWGRGPGCGPSVWRGLTWTGCTSINCSWKPFKCSCQPLLEPMGEADREGHPPKSRLLDEWGKAGQCWSREPITFLKEDAPRWL